MSMLGKICNGIKSLHILKPHFNGIINATRGTRRKQNIPRKRYPFWYTKQDRVMYKDNVSKENKEFVQEIVEHKFGKESDSLRAVQYVSPLKANPIEPKTDQDWTPQSRRTGLIAKKIGMYPMWLKNGEKICTTLLQVIDNHVIKYIPPEEHNPRIHRAPIIHRKLGCLVVGAESVDPQRFTKEYCGLFSEAGVMPKRRLMRFLVSPDAAIQPGTQLHALHYQPGDVIDVRAKTIARGFQGVMKRWGFHGMPATHGVTKTHRRPGNIGSGGERGVIKGTKLPGHMGNKWRVMRGLQIVRINTKYNVLWVRGQSIPGEVNEFVQLYDTILPLKRKKSSPKFPTYFPKPGEDVPEELFIDKLHMYHEPTIEFPEDKK